MYTSRKVPRQRHDISSPGYPDLLYRQECFTGKYTTRKIQTKLHPGPEWRIFHILTSEDIDDVISRSFTVVCALTVGEKWRAIDLSI